MTKDMTTTRTPSAIADEINSIKTQAGAVMASALSFGRRSVLEIGKRLEEAKSLLPHGEWGKWLEENVDYSVSTANNLMRCYQEFGDEQIDMLTGTSDAEFFGILSQSQMVELFSLPKADRRTFVEEHREELESGEMSIRDMKEEIKRLKAENASQAEDIRFNDETYNKLIEEFKQQGEELEALKAAPAPEPVVQEVIVHQPAEEQIDAIRAEQERKLREEFEAKREQAMQEYRKEVEALEKKKDKAVCDRDKAIGERDRAKAELERVIEKAGKDRAVEKELEKAEADHKAAMEKLKADHEKKMAELEATYKKQAKASSAKGDGDTLRIQLALENLRREVRAVTSVLLKLKETDEANKAMMLQAQVEKNVAAIIAEAGWTI